MVADTASIGVNRGLLTFNAEGNNIRESLFYSRVIHFPRMGISGVTIGRGYDIGSRSQQEVFVDLPRAGIAPAQAQAISLGVGLRGKQADDFVKRNRNRIGEITEQQQVNLFNSTYPVYERRAEAVYNAKTVHIEGRAAWKDLHPAIRDVLVDVVYQGYKGVTTMPAAAKNDIDYFIQFIKSSGLITDEKNRNRIGHLELNRGRNGK